MTLSWAGGEAMAVLFVAMVAGILSFLLILLVLLYVQHQQRTNIFSRLRRYNILEAGSADDSSRLEDRFRSILARVASPIAEWRPVQDLDFRMRQAGIPLLGGEFMILLFGVSGIVGIVTWMLTLDGSTAFLFGVVAAGIIWGVVSLRVRRRRNAFTEQLGDCLYTMANALRAGYSFQQCMEVVAREMEPPISDEFVQVNREIAMSVPLDTALEAMAKRVGSGDLDLVVTAVLIQREVGGNLAQILDSISDTIHERIRMKREILALTAQGRLSAWVLILLPFAMALFMFLFNREQLMVIVMNPIGRLALGVAFALEVIGYIVIQRIVNIEL